MPDAAHPLARAVLFERDVLDRLTSTMAMMYGAFSLLSSKEQASHRLAVVAYALKNTTSISVGDGSPYT
jgi:hypothetical protein